MCDVGYLVGLTVQFGPDGNISTAVELSDMKFGSDVHVPISINCNTFLSQSKFKFVQYFCL